MNIIREVLRDRLKAAGYRKRGDTWHYQGENLISVVNLQKSRYDNQYFLNIAFLIREMSSCENPKEQECHVTIRASSLFPENSDILTMACNLDDDSLSDKEREDSLVSFLDGQLLPYCQAIQIGQSLGEAIRRGDFAKGLVTKEAKSFFGVPVKHASRKPGERK